MHEEIHVLHYYFQPHNTGGQLNPKDLVLPLEGIFIIHDWDPEQASKTSLSEDEDTLVPETQPSHHFSEEENTNSISQPPGSQHNRDDSDDEELSTPARLPKHTIAFKVMGVTKLEGVQNLLLRMRELHDEGIQIYPSFYHQNLTIL